ncbi:MAG: RNA polymerase subunit sigma [Verrucomicrobia bacterium]|nr:RNA polymerase subunit sigma [Verrucomicrobiota bacterium]
MSEVTRILNSIADGRCENADEILPLVYEELRQLARQKMAREPAGHTLQPTALVHEAWLRVTGPNEAHWNSRSHFFCAAAEAMRRILVERARRRLARKHGGGQIRMDLEGMEIPEERNPEKLLCVHEALDELAAESSVQADVVKLRFFVGMSHAEIANALGISEKTSKRYWAHAKAWLCQKIKEGV